MNEEPGLFHQRLREGDTSILKKWLKNNDPSKNKVLLSHIVREDLLENFKVIMKDKRTNPNEKNPIGTTILIRIILDDNEAMFDIIVKRKDLDVNIKNKRDMAALDYAITSGKEKYVKALLKLGAKIDKEMYQYAKGKVLDALQNSKLGKYADLLGVL